MSRPRYLESVDCERCQVDNPHRTEHYRADRLRRKWRRQKFRQRHPGAVGSLHDPSCDGPTYCTCRPIAVYAEDADGTRSYDRAP